MDTKTLQELSKAIGVNLKFRDNEKLIDNTIEHLECRLDRLSRIEKVARNQVDTRTEEEKELAKAESVRKFYDGGNKVD